MFLTIIVVGSSEEYVLLSKYSDSICKKIESYSALRLGKCVSASDALNTLGSGKIIVFLYCK